MKFSCVKFGTTRRRGSKFVFTNTQKTVISQKCSKQLHRDDHNSLIYSTHVDAHTFNMCTELREYVYGAVINK